MNARLCRGGLRRALLALGATSLALAPLHGSADGAPAPAATTPSQPPAAAPAKDIVLDSGARPGGSAPESPASAPQHGAVPAAGTALHDLATAAALSDLGLALLRQRSTSAGQAQRNQAVSPLSVATALGMVHAGSAGATAAELAGVLSGTAAGDAVYRDRLPALLHRLGDPTTGALKLAQRVWLDRSVAGEVPATFATAVSQRFRAEGALVDFSHAEEARGAINQWTARATAGLIADLMPAGSLTPNTRFVATNALHFRSRWEQPFDPARTADRPFTLGDGSQKSVPTMIDERSVRHGSVGGLAVLELPFEGSEFVLLVAMAPRGHTLDALEKSLAGLDIAAWSSQLREANCRLSLPRFAVQGRAVALKPALQALGVQTAFAGTADFSPLLGVKAQGVALSEVFHSTTFEIDETGGVAAAGTAATGQVKSFAAPAPSCQVDRPFVFAVVHRATQAPVVIGKIADPGAP